MPVISVVICTHNRDYYLGESLDSVLAQEFEDDDILVVDNASKDQTKQVVDRRLPDNPRLRYVYEGTLGLNVARNRGMRETTAPIIVYFDDDAIAPPKWLQAIHAAFQQYDNLGAAGGKVELIWPPGFTRPQWLSDGLAVNLGAYDLGEEIQLITDAGLTPRGLNYAIRRDVLEVVGSFSLNLDRVGNNLLSNGDLYMTELVLRHGYQVAYLPDAVVKHQVSPERVEQKWYFRRGWWQGVSECVREQNAGLAGPGQLGRGGERMLRGLYKSVKFAGDRAVSFDNLIYAYSQLGYLSTAIKGMLAKPKPTPTQT